MATTPGKYRITNWKEYNKALINRGDITLWFSSDTVKQWHTSAVTSKRGRPYLYSDDAILSTLIMRTVFHLPLRSLQGFLTSLRTLLNLPIAIPSYTQICRRASKLGENLNRLSTVCPKDIVFDSTGLKVYGEGEWKVKKHGTSKHRTWRKLHIGMDPVSGEILIAEMTDNSIGSGDGIVAEKCLPTVPKTVKKFLADGGYDGVSLRKALARLGITPCIPPPKNAIIHKELDRSIVQRNQDIQYINELGGDKKARNYSFRCNPVLGASSRYVYIPN